MGDEKISPGDAEELAACFTAHARELVGYACFLARGDRALAEDLEACGWPVLALNAPQGLRPPLVLQLARLFASPKADVVHTHDDRPNIHGAPAAREPFLCANALSPLPIGEIGRRISHVRTCVGSPEKSGKA